MDPVELVPTAAAQEPDAASAVAVELNEPQALAAAHVEGPLLIFAGAGSGKTRVITYRVANLLAVRRVAPYRILAVTFTNKAAGEMRRRLEGLVGADLAKDLWVGTFHATCAKLLRRHHEAARLGKGFLIYDDADQRSVMGRVLKELKLDEKRYPPRQVLARIHREKQEGRTPAEFQVGDWLDEAILKCFEAYERHLSAANAVDFEDLILKVVRLVEDPESVAGRELRGRFRYVLVDEFQDVNLVQYRLVRGLAAEHRNLCVVGDDDQSIYRWRGADVRIIRGFRRDFPEATVVKLEQNYRSTGSIVKGALGVIRPARDREPKELFTARPDGEPIVVAAVESEHDEAAYVVDRIRDATRRGVDLREVAVFYRVHAQSRVLEEVLRSERIPYQIVGGTKFFERAEIKDLLAYLRLVLNPKSDVDFLRIVNVPARKIGDTTIERLVAQADHDGCSLFDAIGAALDGGSVAGPAKKGLAAFRALVERLRAAATELGPADLCERVVEDSGLRRAFEADESAEAEARLQNLAELVGAIADYEEEQAAAGEVPTLAGYLERVTLAADVDGLEETSKVALMTVHAAKGLEFDTVLLTGMEEEMFPFRGLDPKHAEELEEERRLAYVAVTRARERLHVTHASRRMIFGTTRYGLPSRFIGDLPKSVLRHDSTSPALDRAGRFVERAGTVLGARPGAGPLPESARGPWVHPQAPPSRRTEPERAPGERYVERDETPGRGGWDGEEIVLSRGARVHHDRFGEGTVLEVDTGADPIATVKFSGWGPKRIKVRFLRPG